MINLKAFKDNYRQVLEIEPHNNGSLSRFGCQDTEFYLSPDQNTCLVFYDSEEIRMSFKIGFLGFMAVSEGKIFLGKIGPSWQPKEMELWLTEKLFLIREPMEGFNNGKNIDKIGIRLFDLTSFSTAVIDLSINLYNVIPSLSGEETIFLKHKYPLYPSAPSLSVKLSSLTWMSLAPSVWNFDKKNINLICE